METRLRLDILPQPDDSTCGPTCLHAVYRYYEDEIPLQQVIAQVPHLEEGGTLGVFLARDALKRGYKATIYTYNLHVFDPTWFERSESDILEKIEAQMKAKADRRLGIASGAYIDFIKLGGRIRFEDLTPALIRKFLTRSVPILTGLSATYLYRCAREIGRQSVYDDVRGRPVGHFVVLCGYDRDERSVLVADPLLPNPVSDSHLYTVNIDRLICSILLGIVTHDANLLIIEPRKKR